MTVGELLTAAFSAARQRHPNLAEAWVAISWRVGGRLPTSPLSQSIQREGELDLVIRCLQDEVGELIKNKRNDDLFLFHRLDALSVYWVGGMYEIFRLLKDRKLSGTDDLFDAIFRDLELLRIPLEKYEIAKDRDITTPLQMVRRGDTAASYVYDPKDSKRAHIMPGGLSERGSAMWEVIHLRGDTSYWIERRQLSDQILKLWSH